MTPAASIAANPVTLRQDARVIGLVGMAHAVSHFFHLILASLFPWLKAEFGFSYAQLGLLMTLFFVVSGTGQALAGFVVDRVGARNVLFAGMACLALSALLLSSANGYAMLVAGSMLAGLGNSVFHPADYTLLNQRVSAPRLGHAFSIHGVTGNLGWAAAPVFLATIAGLAGWRTALLCAACIPLLTLAALVWQRDLLGPSRAERQAAAAADAAPAVAGVDLLAFMRVPAVWMCFGFFLISAFALGAIQSFSSASLQALYGMSLTSATVGYTAYMLASAGGTLCGGFLAAGSKRLERNIALAFSAAAAMALVIASGAVPSWLAVALMGGIGFGSGIAAPSRDLLIRAASPKNATGRVYGVVYSGLDVGLAVSPLLFGALMDGGHPAGVFIGIGLFQALAIITAVGVAGRVGAGRTAAQPA